MIRWADALAVAAVGGVLALVFVGCGGSPDKRGLTDGHPTVVPVDLASIPDAVPRHEPLSRYGNPPEYEVFGQRYRTMTSSAGFEERGRASWYGTKFHGRRTSSGEPYDMFAMTAAHRHLPLPSFVEVINLDNGKRVVVRVNDRGPFAGGRIIDLSYAAAHRIGMVEKGVAPVLIRAVVPGDIPAQPVQVAASEPLVRSDAVEPGNRAELHGSYVQVGAFADRDAADRVKQDLRALGFSDVFVTTLVRNPDSPLHRVRIGPLEDASAVQEVAERLHRAALENYRVVVDQAQ
jgi:rare lipoprotein A